MELRHMGSIYVDFQKNEILREVWEKVMVEGKAEGEAIGMLKTLG